MEMTPWQILFGSVMVVMLVTMFGVLFRQGMSPTRREMHEMHRQLREELRTEIREVVSTAVRTATIEIIAEMNRQTAEVNRQIAEVNHRIDETNHRIDETNHRIDRVLAALASHEHINGRVVVTVQADTEPAPAAADS